MVLGAKKHQTSVAEFVLSLQSVAIKIGQENYAEAVKFYHRGGAVAVNKEDLDEMFRLLQAHLLTVPYCDNANSEGHYQQLLYVIFSLFGRYVDVEVHTPTGRVDIVMKTAKALYLFELKLNMSAQAAMKQIDLKDYASKFALSGLPVVKVGINFDPERRTIGDWKF